MYEADDEIAKLFAELQPARVGRTSLPGKDPPSKAPFEEYAEEKVAQVLFDLELELNDHNGMLATWIVVTCIGWGIVLVRAFLSIPTPSELAFSALCFVLTLAFIAARIHSYFIGRRLARKQKFIAAGSSSPRLSSLITD